MLVQVLPINAVLVALLVAAFLRVGRLRNDPPGSRPPRKRLPGWSREPAVVVAAVSCLLVSAGDTVWVGLMAAQRTGTFAGRVGLPVVMCVLLVPALGVTVGTVGLLRGSPAWALATAAQLAAYGGEVIVMAWSGAGSLLYRVPVDVAVLVLVVIALRRLRAAQPGPPLPPARDGGTAPA